ncbi:peroxiredoxin [Aquisalimonas asiatica]|uniref:thioredoxin-dependent peroxiredoxin n=1 Tax=Aquisalimonas asiatica TaxID=406100 RepID=A0A1H8U1E9_9GAMM|nr:peroxiredoxin [Aquisalimonas asiatica]SEO97090.1 peroxiredoxin Q/BCP [Aquisalimonas asiatica]
MSSVTIGEPVADFSLPATGGETIRLSDFRGRHLVLYFYPKASTPGCTNEGLAFTELHAAFREAGAEILGASRDGVKAQENFRNKQGFTFPLLSDKDEQLCTQFGVLKEKTMYGRKSVGIERSTFLIDRDGVLRQEWRGVKVPGHAEAVLEAVQALANG